MKKNTMKNIVSGYIKKKENNLLHVIVKTAKCNVEYIIDCNRIVKKSNIYVGHVGYIPLDIQECGTNIFVYHNANINDRVSFDINAAQYKGNRTYYVPANTGWDDKHAFSKSSIIKINGKDAIDFVPNCYKHLQKETRLVCTYSGGHVYGPSDAANIRASRVREYLERKNEVRIQKILKAVKQR